jgi:hypothetical protein
MRASPARGRHRAHVSSKDDILALRGSAGAALGRCAGARHDSNRRHAPLRGCEALSGSDSRQAAKLLEDLSADFLRGGLLQVMRAFDHHLPGVRGEP